MIRQNWFEVKGDETLALDWPLNENSHVWEIGGYEGRWAQQIWDKFHCEIMIYEPQLWAVDRLHKRFYGNDKIHIQPYGLWLGDVVIPIGNYGTDGASIMWDDGREPKQLGAFISVEREADIVGEYWESPHPIDLALMNIEGAEWDLLPFMIEKGTITSFRSFWCQFHPREDLDPIRFEKICLGMESWHFEMLWDCFPTAVAWRRK